MTYLSRWTPSPGRLLSVCCQPRCEALEDRFLPAVTFNPARIQDALRNAWEASSVWKAEVCLEQLRDLDGDGIVDRVRVSPIEGSTLKRLEIARGRGDESYEPLHDIALSFSAGDLLAEDFDGDGLLDLFLPGNVSGECLLLLGEGDWRFDVTRDVGDRLSLTTAELNGQGKRDLVLADGYYDRLMLAVEGGDPVVLVDRTAGMIGPRNPYLYDIDGDGNLDLLIGNGGRNILMFPGLGGGKFGPEIHGGLGLPIPGGASHFVMAPVQRPPQGPYVESPRSTLAALFVADESSGTISIYHSPGDWSFREAQSFKSDLLPSSLVAQDVDGNGWTDLVITMMGSDRVWLVPGEFDGRLAPEQAHILPVGPRPTQSFVADFDGDQRLDLLTVASGTNELTYYSNFVSTDSTARTIPTGGAGPISAMVRDANSDGMVDLLVAHHQEGRMSLYLGSANGPQFHQTQYVAPDSIDALADGGVDEDGWSIYLASGENGSLELVSFVAASPMDPVIEVPTSEQTSPEPTSPPTVVRLEALSSTSTASLIPMLLTPLHEGSSSGSRLEIEERMGPPRPESSARKSRSTENGGGDELEENEEEAEERSTESLPTSDQLNLQKFVLGLDENPSPWLPPEQARETPPRQEEEVETMSLHRPEPTAELDAAWLLGMEWEVPPQDREDRAQERLTTELQRRWPVEVILMLAAWGVTWERRLARERLEKRKDS